MKTYSAKPGDVVRKWYVVDAQELTLGRMSTKVAELLLGKGKPMFTKHIDCGDYVVVTNAAKLVVTGNKLADTKYYRYSGFPGGMREMALEQKLEKDPANVIELAVKGMLLKNKLAPERLARLRVFVDENHGHAAQKPEKIEVKHG